MNSKKVWIFRRFFLIQFQTLINAFNSFILLIWVKNSNQMIKVIFVINFMFNLVFVNLNDVKLINVIYLNNLFEVNWLEYKKWLKQKTNQARNHWNSRKTKDNFDWIVKRVRDEDGMLLSYYFNNNKITNLYMNKYVMCLISIKILANSMWWRWQWP